MAEIVADHDIESGQLPRAGIHHVPPGPCAQTPSSATSLKAEDSQIAIAQRVYNLVRLIVRSTVASRQRTWSTEPSRATCAIAGQPPTRPSTALVAGPGELPAPWGRLRGETYQSVALVHCSTVFRAGVLALGQGQRVARISRQA